MLLQMRCWHPAPHHQQRLPSNSTSESCVSHGEYDILTACTRSSHITEQHRGGCKSRWNKIMSVRLCGATSNFDICLCHNQYISIHICCIFCVQNTPQFQSKASLLHTIHGFATEMSLKTYSWWWTTDWERGCSYTGIERSRWKGCVAEASDDQHAGNNCVARDVCNQSPGAFWGAWNKSSKEKIQESTVWWWIWQAAKAWEAECDLTKEEKTTMDKTKAGFT